MESEMPLKKIFLNTFDLITMDFKTKTSKRIFCQILSVSTQRRSTIIFKEETHGNVFLFSLCLTLFSCFSHSYMFP